MSSCEISKPYESILFSLIIGDCNIIDPAIDIALSPDGHTLILSNISEKAISELVFPTNSDSNNNKLTLIAVNLSLVINPKKIIIVPGLTQQMIFAFNNSNSKAYRRRGDVHLPFAEIPAGYFSPEKPTLNAPQLTDVLTGITGFTQSTYGKEKLYMLTLTNCASGWHSTGHCTYTCNDVDGQKDCTQYCPCAPN